MLTALSSHHHTYVDLHRPSFHRPWIDFREIIISFSSLCWTETAKTSSQEEDADDPSVIDEIRISDEKALTNSILRSQIITL